MIRRPAVALPLHEHLLNTYSSDSMQADQLAFLEEMIESAELLSCLNCGEDTLHAYEEVISIEGGVTEVVMRCASCLNIRPHLLID